MARYRKIDPRIWNDKNFNSLSDDSKFVFILLLTHPHLTPIGAMRASIAGLASELHWSFERFKKAFDEVIAKNMAMHDETASFVWLPNFLKYNTPESPNVVKSWEQYLDYLPECLLKVELINSARIFIENLSESFHEALPKAFLKAMPNQEQEQKQKQDQKQENEIMSGKPDVNPFNDICALKKQEHIFSNEKFNNEYRSEAKEILEFLNEKTSRVYRPVDTNLQLIIARLKSGATLEQCFQVIAKKTREWKGDAKMAEYLRPATLFNATKFEQYVGELVLPNENNHE